MMSDSYLNLQEPEIFGEFFNTTHQIVYRYLFFLCGGPEQLVEDFTAESYFKAWRKRSSFVGDEKAAINWLFQISKNLVIDEYRKLKSRGMEENIDNFSLADQLDGPEGLATKKEEIRHLLTILKHLPIEKRDILILRYAFDWKVKEIGEYLDIPENTVSVKIKRSLESIRNNWSDTQQG